MEFNWANLTSFAKKYNTETEAGRMGIKEVKEGREGGEVKEER